MIFLTVGTDLPFDRLARAVDQWCADRQETEVFGQLGQIGPTGYRPEHFEWRDYLKPSEFEEKFATADLIIAHAGMGSIITALTLAKPLVIMPRHASLREQRNEHQLATAERFRDRPGIVVADDETVLPRILDEMTQRAAGTTGANDISPYAQESLLNTVKDFIWH